ncbi:MAG: 30S ribosomal protein S7 [Candidatus Paceibacterota bacterium]
MRRKLNIKRELRADINYDSLKLAKFTNYIMESGKKNIARKIVADCMIAIKEKAKVENPLEVFEAALKNTSPAMEVRSRRVGGANYQVPREVRPERKQALSMKWIIEAARSKKGAPIHLKLADEIVAASKNEGEAVKKRENVHKMAEANKAFAHFAW